MFRYNCVFIDIHISHFYRDQLITDTQVDEAIKNILEGIKNQTRSRCTSEDMKEPDPDLRYKLDGYVEIWRGFYCIFCSVSKLVKNVIT